MKLPRASILAVVSCTTSLLLCGAVSAVWAQSEEMETPFQFFRPAPREWPAAVKAAEVKAEIWVPGGAGGAALIIQRISPPVLPPPPAAPRVVQQLTPEQRAAIRAAAPLETKLFSPSITLYPNGISLVNWGSVRREHGWVEFEAWVDLDLASIQVCLDFEVGRTRYVIMPFAYPAEWSRMAIQRAVPNRNELHDGYLLTKGDAADAAAMEPLVSLLQLYAQEGDKIHADYRAIVAWRAAYEKWERENPEPVKDTEIRLWPVQSTEYPTSNSR